MFKRTQCTHTYGDSSAGYEVELDQEYTVGSFIEEVLANHADEWGYIGINNGKNEIFRDLKCEYRHGEITSKNLPEEILGISVDQVSAYGGWTKMDYLLNVGIFSGFQEY